jgi:hypothetical protein
MSDTKHTPGPWVPNDQHSGSEIWRVESDNGNWANDGYIIASLLGPDAEANARLIAAAPDLLKALRWIMRECDGHPDIALILPIAPFAYASGAIAKATGVA